MPQAPKLPDITSLQLTRLGDAGDAGLLVTSLPLPRRAPTSLGLGDRPGSASPLGQWHDVPVESPSPRRLLLAADGGTAPAAIDVCDAAGPATASVPAVDMELFETSPDEALMWERHRLRIAWGGRTVSLAMGLRTGGAVHWWENCALDVIEETPFTTTVEMGGAIALVQETRAHRQGESFFDNPLLHRHNWLNGHIRARLHANGVCEVVAHHVNARFFDDGLDLEDAVPVIGLRVEGAEASQIEALAGPWDGSAHRLQLGDVAFCTRDAARLATPAQPGDLSPEPAAAPGGFLVWQPYQGMELYGGEPCERRTGSPYVCRAEQRRIPRGLARTVRFSLSLNPERSPRVARYLAPAWWYGLCEELSAQPLLPAANEYDQTLEACVDWCLRYAHDGGFEDGSIPRMANEQIERPEPGWEGEAPYTLLLQAWRSGRADVHDLALRAAYLYTDVGIDHASKMTRMHAYSPGAYAIPMNRVQACVAAWLETGDDYLLHTAHAVVDNAWSTHLNSWPRMCVGRDAAFARGAVYLFRYTADRHYLDIARQVAGHAARTQRPDGSFGDQGGGVGIHGEGAYITKPWMGFIACGAALDLIDMGLADGAAREMVRRFAAWLRRVQHPHDHGVRGWDYQHEYNGKPQRFDFNREEWDRIATDAGGVWKVDYLARFLTFCSLDQEDAWFFDAWVETYDTGPTDRQSDHDASESLQFVTWVQDRLWNASLDAEGRVVAAPVWMGPRTPDSGIVQTPAGPVVLRWRDGEVTADPAIDGTLQTRRLELR